MDRYYDVLTFLSKDFTLMRPGVVNFADIITIAGMFIRATF